MVDELVYCEGFDCPIKKRCLRFTERRSKGEFMLRVPFEDNTNPIDCDFLYTKNDDDLDKGIDRYMKGTN